MGQLILTRHAESVYNAERRYTGHTDVALSEKGRQEARELGRRLQDIRFDRVYLSALQRTLETWQLASEALGAIPVLRSAMLNECHHGQFEGHTREEAIALFGEAVVQGWRTRADYAPPGGQSVLQHTEEAWPYFEANPLKDAREGMNILVIGHGRSLQGLIGRMQGTPVKDILKLNITGGIIHRFQFQPAV
jgi:2,3-bisphosphoglycerate-dependent phosphoglycerate mutase